MATWRSSAGLASTFTGLSAQVQTKLNRVRSPAPGYTYSTCSFQERGFHLERKRPVVAVSTSL
jgi:hypothetical protein